MSQKDMSNKPLNVMNAKPDQIAENREIKDLNKILGIREGVDYSIEENFQTLRYGHVMLVTDEDIDRIHISELVEAHQINKLFNKKN